MAVLETGLDGAAQFQTINAGHHHIGHDKRDIAFCKKVQSLLPVARRQHCEILFQHAPDQFAQLSVVIHKQDGVIPVQAERPGKVPGNGRHLHRAGLFRLFTAKFFTGVGRFSDRDTYSEDIALPLVAPHLNRAFVQLHKVLDKGEPYAGSYRIVLAVIPFVEAFEQAFDGFFGHKVPAVGYFHPEHSVRKGGNIDTDFSSLGRVLGCVGKQVVDYLVEFVGVEASFNLVRAAAETQLLLLAGNQRSESLYAGGDKTCQITFEHGQFQIAALHLAELQHLLQESCQTGRIDRKHLRQIGAPMPLGKTFDRCVDDAQRSHQLVCHIGVELEFEMVQLLNLLGFHTAEIHLLAGLHPVVSVPPRNIGKQDSGKYVSNNRPRRKQRIAQHPNLQSPFVDLLPSRSPEAEKISPGGNIFVARRMTSFSIDYLFLIVSFKYVRIGLRLRIPFVQQGETDGEGVDVVVYLHLLGIVDVPLAHLPALPFRKSPERRFSEPQVRKAESLIAGRAHLPF